MRGKMSGGILWELVSPVLLYFLLSAILTGILELAVPVLGLPQNAMWLLTLVNSLQIPVFLWLYRKQKSGKAAEFYEKAGRRTAWRKRFGMMDLLLAFLGGFFLSRGFNGLISLTPLPRLFPAYETVTETFYGGSVLSLILASVVTAPILEETLTRGLIYGRLRAFFSDPRPALFLGALVFALFHGNVVQGIYAFFLGLYFVCLYERYRSLLPSVLAHASANASSILLERTGWMDALYADLPAYFLTVAICLAAGAFCFGRTWKRKNPI